MNLFMCLPLLCICFLSCSKDGDQEKIVTMTIYPETGYVMPILSPYWVDVLVYSESDENQKGLLMDIITEGFDFEYERGYEYTFKAKKVWMSNPPMDVSSIKYIYVGPLTKKKIIIENSEEEIELTVSSETVEYVPCFPIEYDEYGNRKIYDALLVSETNATYYSTAVLKEIEGFEFESGYEYILSVKKITQANPYLLRYVWLDTKEKKEIAQWKK